MSWNAGHLGQQQWGELKTWLVADADQYCDVLVLQETHWKEPSEFRVSGWYCVSSASTPEHSKQPKAPNARRKSRRNTQDGPSTTRADGVMILFSPRFDAKCIRWKEWLQGRVLEARAVLDGARIVIAAIYQHVWSAAKTLQANKDDRAQVLSALAKVVRQVPKRDSFVIAGDFNTSLRPHPALVRPDEQNLTNLLVKLRLVGPQHMAMCPGTYL